MVELEDLTRDKDNTYCINIIIWLDGQPTPFTFTYPVIKAEYTITKRWYWYDTKELIKYPWKDIPTHPRLHKGVYERYLKAVEDLTDIVSNK